MSGSGGVVEDGRGGHSMIEPSVDVDSTAGTCGSGRNGSGRWERWVMQADVYRLVARSFQVGVLLMMEYSNVCC